MDIILFLLFLLFSRFAWTSWKFQASFGSSYLYFSSTEHTILTTFKTTKAQAVMNTTILL